MLRFHFLFHCIVFYYFFFPPKLMALDLVIASILYLVHYMLQGAVSPLLISSLIYLSQFYFVGDLYHTLACRSM
jgi:hypothetical protein